jgi:hypothetical protein
MFHTLFDLINHYVYGGTAVAGTIHYDVATLLSTVLCCAVVAFPFFIVFNAVKLFTGGLR